ncbi:MAG TPA: hypothetical protein VMT76_08225 [Puia sp.]|nr:hypothetical protein [Puia sp.]
MKFIFILFLLPLQLFSQDLSGIWVGTIATSETQMPLELVINQDMSGYSMMTFTYKGAEKIAVKKMTMIRKDSTFTMSDDKMIYNNFNIRSRNVKTYCDLSIKMVDSVMVLSGPFHTRTRDLRAGDEDLATGTITLKKQSNKAQTKLIGKLDSLKLSNTISFSNPEPGVKENMAAATIRENDLTNAKAQNLAVSGKIQGENNNVPGSNLKIADKATPSTDETPDKDAAIVKVQQPVSSAKGKNKTYNKAPNSMVTAPVIAVEQKVNKAAADILIRKTEVIRSIDFKSDSLVLILYDNGIVDGDTVSVVLNNKVIIPKQGLSEKACRKVIKITPDLGDSLQLVMYAENLGSIPPNTGLLIVEDGTDRQEIRFEGDMKKSSAVVFRRRR